MSSHLASVICQRRLAKPAACAATSITKSLAASAGAASSVPRVSTISARHMQRAYLSTSPARRAKNQVFSPIRNPDSFQTYLLHSSSARTPLITLWTASWCPTCRTVEPLIQSLIESGVGEQDGGVCFAPIEFDAPDIMSPSGSDSLAMTYMITSIPTLLSFDAGEAQTTTKISDGKRLSDREFLIEWIRNEAKRHGGRGGGGGDGTSSFGGLFGGLFGGKK